MHGQTNIKFDVFCYFLQSNCGYFWMLGFNPLAYTAVRETAGLARSINTQPAVRRSEPSMSFAFNSSLLSVDGMTCLLPFESWWNALLKRSFKN